MKRRWIIGLPTVVAVIATSLALLAIVRRHRAQLSLAELEKTDRTIRAAILLSRRPVAGSRPARRISPEEPAPASAASSLAANAPARPDVNAIFAAHPELEAAYRKATLGKLHQTYDRLWNRMGLSSAQIEQVFAILMRDDENEMDLAMTANALKLSSDDPSLRQFRGEENTVTRAALESALGSQGYQTLQDYNRALTVQSAAEDVASLTAASGSPMTGAQTEQLTQVLAEASASYRNGGRPNWISTDWEQVLSKAPLFLTPPQVTALQAKAQQAKVAAMLAQFYASRAPH